MDVERLEDVWFHSSEEDDGDRVVYRPRSFEFPRARAPRESLAFEHDGTVAFGDPGPADAPEHRSGTWKVAGEVLTVSSPTGEEIYSIESLDQDALVLRRQGRRKAEDGQGQ